MDNTFYILDSFLLPTGYNHMFMAKKIGRGFEYNGFKVKVIEHINQITSPGFVLVSDHPVYYSLGMRQRQNPNGDKRYIIPAGIQKLDQRKGPIEKISKYLQHKEYIKLTNQIKGKGITVIAWSLYNEKKLFDGLGIPTIHSFDLFNQKPIENNFHSNWYDFCRENENALPLLFAADVQPNKVGEGCINEKYKLSFIGDKSYIQRYTKVYGDDKECKLVATPPWITEKEKVGIYKNSRMNLGLRNKLNRQGDVIGERTFEAMAFGAIPLTDSKAAVKITKGNVAYIKDMEDIESVKRKVEELNNNPKKRKAMRKKGFEYIRKDGTWAHRAEEFIKMSNKLYETNF